VGEAIEFFTNLGANKVASPLRVLEEVGPRLSDVGPAV